MTLLENIKDITNFPWRLIFYLPFVPSARHYLREWMFEQSFRFFTWPEIMTSCYKTFCQNFFFRFWVSCVVRYSAYFIRSLQTIHCTFFPSQFNLLVIPQSIVPWDYFISKVLALSPLSVSFFSCPNSTPPRALSVVSTRILLFFNATGTVTPWFL